MINPLCVVRRQHFALKDYSFNTPGPADSKLSGKYRGDFLIKNRFDWESKMGVILKVYFAHLLLNRNMHVERNRSAFHHVHKTFVDELYEDKADY